MAATLPWPKMAKTPANSGVIFAPSISVCLRGQEADNRLRGGEAKGFHRRYPVDGQFP